MSDLVSQSSFSAGTDTPPMPPKKRPRLHETATNGGPNDKPESKKDSPISSFCPKKMRLVSVLGNDTRTKRLILHTRCEDTPDKEAIVILQKSAFPSDAKILQESKVVRNVVDSNSTVDNVEDASSEAADSAGFPVWDAKSILTNDVYHRLLVTKGLESVNGIDMTVIHPAEPHHFKRYVSAGRRIIQETPEMYYSAIIPFLSEQPRDLSWVDNILAGTAEQDRVLFADPDPVLGFTLVLDYRWNGQRLQELHCLGISRDPNLTCLRDLRSVHIPMLKRILMEGRKQLTAKYCGGSTQSSNNANNASANEETSQLNENQIMAYLHYPPTFYRLHVHFVHVDVGDDGGTRTGRAHLLDEVIRNLEIDGEFYSKRVMTIYLHDNSPMLAALNAVSKDEANAVGSATVHK